MDLSNSHIFSAATPKERPKNSDVDLYVSTSLSGLQFVGLIERLRGTLHKKVDVIRESDLDGNMELANEIRKDGIQISGWQTRLLLPSEKQAKPLMSKELWLASRRKRIHWLWSFVAPSALGMRFGALVTSPQAWKEFDAGLLVLVFSFLLFMLFGAA